MTRREAARARGVVITRAAGQADDLARAVEAAGGVAMFEPVLAIAEVDGAILDLAGVQALAFTSANGVRAFSRRSAARDLPAFAVGGATAAACRDAGFSDVRNANGDVRALAALITANLAPDAGAVLHPSGADVAGDLAGALGAAGIAWRRTVVYRAVAASSLSAATVQAFRSGAVAVAVFFSPRGAAIFARLAREQGLLSAFSPVVAVCLSAAVRDPLAPLNWAGIAVADETTPSALLGRVKETLAAIP